MPLIEVTIVGGPHGGERCMIDPVSATAYSEGATAPPQHIKAKVYAVPITWTRRGWIADWYRGKVL